MLGTYQSIPGNIRLQLTNMLPLRSALAALGEIVKGHLVLHNCAATLNYTLHVLFPFFDLAEQGVCFAAILNQTN